jgi:hypothetical protein
MTRRPRIFPSHLSGRERVVYRAVTFFFVALFFALIWPVYGLFGGIRPLILGVPFSLAYVVCLLLAGFVVLLALFLWEGRRPDPDDPPGDRA